MCEKAEIGKSLSALTPKAVQPRLNRLLSGVRERLTREVAESTAGAILTGKTLDELYFEDLGSLDGLEEAILHVIGPARLQSGNENAAVLGVRTAVENLSVEIADRVKRAGATVKAREGSDLWTRTRERIADLIYDETLRRPAAASCAEREGKRSNQGSLEGHHAGATHGPAWYRRLGMVALSEGNSHPDAEANTAPDRDAVTRTDGQRRQEPQCADDHVLLGTELEPKLAMAEYQKALALDPNHVMAHFFLAESFEALGNPEAAKAEFLRVTQLVPNDPDAHWHLAEILYDTGDPEAAAVEYAYALTIAPADEGILDRHTLLDDWMKDRLRELTRGTHQEAQAVSIRTTSSEAVGPKKSMHLADLKKTPEGKFDLSGLSKNELADLLWEEAGDGEDK